MVFISNKYKFIFIHIPKTGGQTIKATLHKIYRNDFKRKDCNTLEYAALLSSCTKKSKKHIMFRSPRHLTMDDINNIYNKKYFTFTFIRNPYDRFYSTYNHFKIRIYKFLYIITAVYVILIISLIYSILKQKNILFYISFLLLLFINIYIGFYLKYYKWTWQLISNNFNFFIKNNIFKINKSLYGDLFKPQYDYINNNKIDFIGRQENFNNDINNVLNILNIKIDIVNKNVRNSNSYTGMYKYINKYNNKSIKIINKIYDIDFKKFNYKKLSIN